MDGMDVIAMSAIGQPEQFFAFLSNHNVIKKVTFDDHHIYSDNEIPEGIVITTEKDAVKMKNFKKDNIYALKLRTVIDVKSLFSDN